MNLNFRSVAHVLSYYNIKCENMLIVHDELDLFPGEIKIKFSNGHNGHNGLRGIVNFFKNRNFYRISIGIGRPQYCGKISSYVLSSPNLIEKRKIKFIINKMTDITDNFINNPNVSFTNKLLCQFNY